MKSAFSIEPSFFQAIYRNAARDCCTRLLGRFLPRLRPPFGAAFFGTKETACQLLNKQTFKRPFFVPKLSE
jgi:hypothetical protein